MYMLVKTVKVFSLFLVAGMLGMGSAMAQSDAEISDEDLKSYIMVMDSVDQLRTQLSEDVSEMIKSHELMDGGRAYSKIKAANGDAEKLEEEGISEEQIEAYEELQEQVTEMQAELNSTFSDMVKEHVGIAEYNKIRKGLSADEELKARYEALAAEMNDDEESGEDDGSQPAGQGGATKAEGGAID